MVDVLIFTDLEFPGFYRYAGAYRVASELRSHGFQVQVVDFFNDLTMAELYEIIDTYVSDRTLFVGIAGTFLGKQFFSADDYRLELRRPLEQYQLIAERIREKNSKTKLVMGGAYAGYFQFPTLIDYWVTGLADASIVRLARHLKYGDPLISHPVVGTTNGREIKSDKDYPFDGFSQSKINWHKSDHIFQGEFLPIEIARGCIFRCAFCSFRNGKNADDYLKCEDVLREELIYNYETYGITGYVVCDDNFNDSIEKVRNIHRLFTSLPFKIEFISYNRIDIYKRYPEMRELLLEAGQIGTHFGIETFHHKTGLRVGKGLHPDETKRLLYFLKEKWGSDVQIGASFILGLPDEPLESIEQTFQWLDRDDSPIDSYLFFPLSFAQENSPSKFQQDPAKYGYELTGPNRYDWKNSFLTGHEANVLALQIMLRAGHKNRTSAFGYAHFRNIGYSRETILNISRIDEANGTQDMSDRRNHLKQQYLKRLLKSQNRIAHNYNENNLSL